MEFIYFTITGIIVYVLADTILRKIESMRKTPLPNRSIIFFVIFLPLVLIMFEAVQYMTQSGAP